MSIDTQAKRQSAIACRRLPWFRRFAVPFPDGTIGQGDRQTTCFVYSGVLAGPPVVVFPAPMWVDEVQVAISGAEEVQVSLSGPEELQI